MDTKQPCVPRPRPEPDIPLLTYGRLSGRAASAWFGIYAERLPGYFILFVRTYLSVPKKSCFNVMMGLNALKPRREEIDLLQAQASIGQAFA
jgi:hypothetical protein